MHFHAKAWPHLIMDTFLELMSSFRRRLHRMKARREELRRHNASQERDDLLASGDQPAFLAALSHQFPDAVQPAKSYLASLDETPSRDAHRFVVTHQREGRIESFHHFLGALFYPLILHEAKFGFEPGSVLHVQDCGSLNRHLEKFSEYIGATLRFFPAEIASSLAAANADKLLRLPPFDGSNFSDKWLHDHEIEAIRSFGFKWAANDAAADIPVLVISRGESDRYFATERFRNFYPVPERWNQTGSSRRHIPNEAEMIQAISNEITPHVVQLETTDFSEQIELFKRARIVIGQHGAGLNGLLWCKPGTCVLEILPYSMLGEPDTFFRNMALRLNLRHSFMIQNGEHEPVDPRAIARYVDRHRVLSV